uniref:Cell adhesion molecule 2-like n=1 Tax=Petromyzon marinus TaxID=7757 RepID=A0AAJ7UB69_PETMA|nr:cell adhesion molecule 2-like [Petromyzon marinus]
MALLSRGLAATAAFIGVIWLAQKGVQSQAPVTQDERAIVGDAVVLTCRVDRADGSPIQWSNPAGQTVYFGDKRALKDSRIELVHANKSELSVLINNVTLDDEGDYRCSLFTDDVQTVVSVLTVYAVPEDPVIGGYESPVVEGAPVSLLCSTAGSKPAARLSWLRDGKSLSGAVEERVSEAAWGGRTFAVTSRVAFRATRDLDQARLTCEVTHEALQDSLSSSVTLTVHCE